MRTDIRETSSALFQGPTIAVAKRLIGATLYRRIPSGRSDAGTMLAGRIVETEAYLPLVDAACHGYRGPTKRAATLFGRAGRAYIYLIYGMYYCLNVTTEPPGIGGAVLVRAVEPLRGLQAMRRRRGAGVPDEALACGPGNLCKAMSIDLRDDTADLLAGDLTIAPANGSPPSISASARIGLNVARNWQLRFFDADSPSVSPFRKGRNRAHKNGAISR